MEEMQLMVVVSAKVAVTEGVSRSGPALVMIADILPLLTAEERSAFASALVRVSYSDVYPLRPVSTTSVYEMRGAGSKRAPLLMLTADVTPQTVAAAIRDRLATPQANTAATRGAN